MTSPEVGLLRIIPWGVAALVLAPVCLAQTVIEAPPSAPMVDVLRETYDAPDPRTRLESVRWLRARTTPAAFQILRRATRDPVPEIAFEGLMGLAEIAPEYELDGYQMRHLDPASRARLIRIASAQGLMSLASLRAIAMDSSADAGERAEALLAMRALGEEPRPSLWLPMLGAQDQRVRLLAALSVITDAPRIRSVAVAQEHAASIVRFSVRDVAAGRVDAVLGALEDARRAPTDATADWCLALLGACETSGAGERSSEVSRGALRTLLAADPHRAGVRERWLGLRASATTEDSRELSLWALETAVALDARGVQIPAWLGELPTTGPEIVRVIAEGGAEARAIGVRLVLGLPASDRGMAIVSILERAEEMDLEADLAQTLARELAVSDPIAARALLEREGAESPLAWRLVLEGVWSEAVPSGSGLELARAVHLAEREIEGARSAERSALADQLDLVAEAPAGFDAALRAEAAWLALVLRDQTSEAMAYLPLLSPVYDADLSLELEHADSLWLWAQMPYP